MSNEGAARYISKVDQEMDRDLAIVEQAAVINPSTRRVIAFRSARELLAIPSPIPWIITNYLASNTVAALIGQPGCGKTFLALDWACCIATGKSWGGERVSCGAVFIIAGEGQSGFGRRLKAWETAHGCDLANAPLYVSAGAAMLDEATIAKAVSAECERLAQGHGVRPTLIVVDTLARNFGGEENSATDVGALIANLDTYLRTKWDCCVLIVHHVGLNDQAQTRARGSSALRGALDAEFLVKRQGEQLTIACTKAKDWEPPSEVVGTFTVVKLSDLDEDSEPMTSCVISTAAATLIANMKGATQKQKKARQLLVDMYAAKRSALRTDDVPEACARVSEDEFRRELESIGVTTEGETDARHQWRDLQKQLRKRNLVRWEGEYVYPVTSNIVGKA
jgi:hypothetical protein